MERIKYNIAHRDNAEDKGEGGRGGARGRGMSMGCTCVLKRLLESYLKIKAKY